MIPGKQPDAPPAPTRDEVEERLVALVGGSADVVAISEWAGRWALAEDPGVEDPLVWDMLTTLYGVDMPDLVDPARPPRLIHGPEDYAAWLEEFLAARAADEGRSAASPRRAG